ncbi:MAG: hypothetical protein HND57_16090 [Planctomycetes bacterium]|nr:hypothetical protein [Planctomycetota bacterium]
MNTDARLQYDRDLLQKRIGEMEQKISELNTELTKSNRLATLGVLSGMVMHEFNNLLAHISGYAQLAQNTPEDRELVAKSLTRTIEGTEQLTRIASALLGFMRGDQQLQSANIHRVIDEALLCLARDPSKDGIRFVRQVPPNLRVGMRPICLQQVLLNLMLNSIDAMRQSGGELKIFAQPLPGGQVCIKVADTGGGLPEDVARNAFKPLANAAMADPGLTSTSKPSGHGLGLSICHHLVTEAQGRIEFQTSPQSGTVFTVILPVESREDSCDNNDQNSRRSA